MLEQDFPVLIAQNGPLKGERWVIDCPLMLGRDAGCDVVIPDRQVSRYHVRLTPQSGGIVIEDLGSKNGTRHNGLVLSAPVTLQDGDLIQVAMAQEFLYLNSDATMPLDSPLRPARLALDIRSRQVWVRGRQLSPPLSAQQFQLLWVLYQKPGEVIARSDLIAAVWGEQQAAGVSEQALDALLRRVRDRMGEIDPGQSYISTLRGHGIRLDIPVE